MSLSSPLIYLAGPDLFFPDAHERYAHLNRICEDHGMRIVLPLQDDTKNDPRYIFEANIRRLRSADAVLANLMPFRGFEPDSGTVFEAAHAFSIGLPVGGYTGDHFSVRERLNQAGNLWVDPADGQCVDSTGVAVEDFGLPTNLMLASAMMLHDCPEAAVASLDLVLKQVLSA